jgi:GTPase SAR1 family protein
LLCVLTVFAVFVMIGASPTSKSFHVAVPSRATAVRMVVLGPPGVGASSLVRRFCVDTFQESGTDSSSSSSSDASSSSTSSFSSSSSSSSSWGARFHSKLLLAAEQVLRFQLWDVPGGDELLAPVYLANAHVLSRLLRSLPPQNAGSRHRSAARSARTGDNVCFVCFVCLFVRSCLFCWFFCVV